MAVRPSLISPVSINKPCRCLLIHDMHWLVNDLIPINPDFICTSLSWRPVALKCTSEVNGFSGG